jgi:hypothetical protein
MPSVNGRTRTPAPTAVRRAAAFSQPPAQSAVGSPGPVSLGCSACLRKVSSRVSSRPQAGRVSLISQHLSPSPVCPPGYSGTVVGHDRRTIDRKRLSTGRGFPLCFLLHSICDPSTPPACEKLTPSGQHTGCKKQTLPFTPESINGVLQPLRFPSNTPQSAN